MENSSREFTYGRVKEMIEYQREKYNWEFMFMGANIDVASEGSRLGVNPSMSMSYTANPMGTANMFMSAGAVATALRIKVRKTK